MPAKRPRTLAGSIVPNKKIGGAAGHSVTIHQVINVDSRSDQASIQAAMRQAKNAAKAEILENMRRNGAFAR